MMDFIEAMVLMRRGSRVRRATWKRERGFGLYVERAGSGNFCALGYGYHRGQTQVWRTAAIDVLAHDWEECEEIAIPARRMAGI